MPQFVPPFAPGPLIRATRLAWIAAAGAFALFLTLAISFSLTRGPWWDEGVFADVAVTFRNSGHLRSSVLASFSYDDLPAVDRYMYWQLPGYLIALGGWFHLGPVSAQWMRMLSVLSGCIFAAAWFLFVRAISRNETLALLVASVVMLDNACVAASSNGRMDMLCAALGEAALAAYVSLRESHINRAAVVAGCFGAACLFTHPMALIPNVCLTMLMQQDWRKFRANSIALFAAPYLICAAFWLRYLMQAPQLFLAQARNVSAYRVGGPLFILRNIANDLGERYLQFYFAPHSGSHKLKIFSLLFGFVGFLVLAFYREMRRQPLTKLLLSFALVAYLGLAALDDLKFPYYFVYVTPIFSACGAVWLYQTFHRSSHVRWISAWLPAAFVLATVANTTYYIRRNDLRNDYQPVVKFVKANLAPGDIVMGPSELGFALGFGPPLVDDCTLGFTSGIEPKLFVMYPVCRMPGYSPFIASWSRRQLATNYHMVLEHGGYAVYLRNPIAWHTRTILNIRMHSAGAAIALMPCGKLRTGGLAEISISRRGRNISLMNE